MRVKVSLHVITNSSPRLKDLGGGRLSYFLGFDIFTLGCARFCLVLKNLGFFSFFTSFSLDSRKHVLGFFPYGSPSRFSFSSFRSAGILLLEISQPLPEIIMVLF